MRLKSKIDLSQAGAPAKLITGAAAGCSGERPDETTVISVVRLGF